MSGTAPSRAKKIERLRKFLLSHTNPRWQMFTILALTGLSGFLASFGLHWLGMNVMGVRYPLAVGVAYGVFVGLIGIWLSLQRRYSKRRRPPAPAGSTTSADSDSVSGDAIDAVDAVDSGIFLMTSTGGNSAGRSTSSSGVGELLGDIGGGDSDGEGIVVVIVIGVIIVALGTALIASGYVLWEAPALMAEVIVDGSLMAGMARRLRSRSEHHWTVGVIRRTWLPALLVAVTLSVAGFILQALVPEAHSMGAVLRHVLR